MLQNAALSLDSKIVSSVHAKIKIENGAIYFADLGSTNGTYIMRSGSYVRMKGKSLCRPVKRGNDVSSWREGAKKSMTRKTKRFYLL